MRLTHLAAALLAALVGSGAQAANVDGKWQAEIPSPRGEMKMTFNLQTDGEKLTGTVANDRMGESEIQDGKINGDEISFKQVLERGRTITFVYSGKVKDGEIEFTREIEGGPQGGGPRAGGGEPERPRGRSGGRGPGGMGRKITFTAKRVN